METILLYKFLKFCQLGGLEFLEIQSKMLKFKPCQLINMLPRQRFETWKILGSSLKRWELDTAGRRPVGLRDRRLPGRPVERWKQFV